MDGAYTWNSSQVWSDGVTDSYTTHAYLNPGRSVAGAFTGNVYSTDPSNAWGVAANAYNGIGTLTFDNPFTGISEVAIWTYTGASGATIIINEGESDEQTTPMPLGINRITFSTNNLKNVAINTPDYSGSNLTGIEVDGEILVDAGFGSNGFYLPFDPAQTGANYTQYGGGTMDDGMGWENLFDGNLNTIAQPNRAAGGVATWTYPDQGIPVSSTLKFELIANGDAIYKVNGTEYPKGKKEFTAAEIGGFFKSVSFYNTSGSQYCLGKSVYVDGAILVDHSSIGVDMSGNNNNLHDQNFGVGNSSQIWSKNSSSSGTTNGLPRDAFDGKAKPLQATDQLPALDLTLILLSLLLNPLMFTITAQQMQLVLSTLTQTSRTASQLTLTRPAALITH